MQQAKAQAAFKAGEYGDYASVTADARNTEYARSGYKKNQVSAEQRYKEYVQGRAEKWKDQQLKYIRAQQKAKQDMALQDKKNKILLYDQYGEVIR